MLDPIPLVPGTTARQDGWTYRLDRSRHPDRGFDLYSFTYVVYNHSASTSPSSPALAATFGIRLGPGEVARLP